MRRIQLYIEEDVDHALTAAAARTGRSRSAVMRDAVHAWLGGDVGPGPDPVDELIGTVEAADTDDIDAVLYDR